MDIMFRESLSDFILCSWWTFSIEITFIPPQNLRNISNCYMSAVSLKKIQHPPVTLHSTADISHIRPNEHRHQYISCVCVYVCMWHVSLNETGWADLLHNHMASALLSPSIREKWDMTQSRKAIQVYTRSQTHTHTQTLLLQSDIKHCCKHYGNARVQMPSNGSLLNSI